MVLLKVRTRIPAAPPQVFEYVTAFSSNGPADQQALESKYGRLLEQEGNTYIFLESAGAGITWRCTFDPPSHRAMRAVGSNWSDRFDWFEPASNGTTWFVAWELKATGVLVYVKWMFFHLWDKRRARRQMITPVLMHFQRLRME